tara:strand:- start:133 stop:273 length:141 start_codon:yes stop_codon:yes gene_type:complete
MGFVTVSVYFVHGLSGPLVTAFWLIFEGLLVERLLSGRLSFDLFCG